MDLLAFIQRAQELGFTLDEIRDIVSIKRTGQTPCPRVCNLIRRKAEELDQRLSDLTEMRKNLRTLINGWGGARTAAAAVCPIIERPRLREPRK